MLSNENELLKLTHLFTDYIINTKFGSWSILTAMYFARNYFIYLLANAKYAE